MKMCAITFIVQYKNLQVVGMSKKKKSKGISWKLLDSAYKNLLEALRRPDLEVDLNYVCKIKF